jgi:hypothetical protein
LYIRSVLSSSKCSLFHNSNVFGSCVIHILYTGCAKIKKIPASNVKNRTNEYEGLHCYLTPRRKRHSPNLEILGSQLNQTNSTSSEIQANIISGNRCYYSYGAVMKSRALNRSSKLKIYTTLIRPAVTYGCEA